VDIAVCSADFRSPGTEGAGEVLDYLLGRGVRWAAVTDGARPITWAASGSRGEIDVPAVDVTDTLAAGDIFHGAIAHAIAGAGTLDEPLFTSALRFAAELAAHSCRTFGTRSWMKSWTEADKD
jgi:sugar/nucleoside kinase (ribokinase family)